MGHTLVFVILTNGDHGIEIVLLKRFNADWHRLRPLTDRSVRPTLRVRNANYILGKLDQ